MQLKTIFFFYVLISAKWQAGMLFSNEIPGWWSPAPGNAMVFRSVTLLHLLEKTFPSQSAWLAVCSWRYLNRNASKQIIGVMTPSARPFTDNMRHMYEDAYTHARAHAHQVHMYRFTTFILHTPLCTFMMIVCSCFFFFFLLPRFAPEETGKKTGFREWFCHSVWSRLAACVFPDIVTFLSQQHLFNKIESTIAEFPTWTAWTYSHWTITSKKKKRKKKKEAE